MVLVFFLTFLLVAGASVEGLLTVTRSPSSGRGRVVVRSAGGDNGGVGKENTQNKGPLNQQFDQTPAVVKSAVSALTDLFVGLDTRQKSGNQAAVAPPHVLVSHTPEQLLEGLRRDYLEAYLWTGDIDPSLYEPSCSFTDPTISFKGLDVFQRNVASLRPLVNNFVDRYGVQLLSIERVDDESSIVARWRMWGELNFFWKPCIDVVGRTQFIYSPQNGNRVCAYNETWEISAAEALLQLLRPNPRGLPY